MGHYILQTAMGAAGSFGFAVVFGIRDRKLVLITAGGALGWASYLVSVHAAGLNLFYANFAATLVTALLAELLARIVHTPVILLLVPMLIPLIPGGDLYYMMDHFVRKNYDELGGAGTKVLTEAGAIAMGIVVGAYIALTISVFLQKIRQTGSKDGPGV